VGEGEEMTQTMYAHVNKLTIIIIKFKELYTTKKTPKKI
jgi:hypothetical protein